MMQYVYTAYGARREFIDNKHPCMVKRKSECRGQVRYYTIETITSGKIIPAALCSWHENSGHKKEPITLDEYEALIIIHE